MLRTATAADLHVAKADSDTPIRGINRAKPTVMRCLALLLRHIQTILVVVLMMLHCTFLSTSRVNLLTMVGTPTVMTRHIGLHRAVATRRRGYGAVGPHGCSKGLPMRGIHLVESILLHRYFIFLLKIVVRAERH